MSHFRNCMILVTFEKSYRHCFDVGCYGGLTLVIGHIPQGRVTGVALALTLIEASLNPTL